MSEEATRSRRITLESTIGRADADLLGCGNCACEVFYIYTVRGQEHPHFQCVGCGHTYCSLKGGCHGEQAEDDKATTPAREN
jgi:hypothetical protein